MGLLYNRVKQAVSGTPGTGAITLGSAASGYRTLATAGITNGAVVNYVLEDGSNWEYGEGTYSTTGPTLTRTTILASSNGGAAITATSASTVYCDAFAETFVPVTARNAQSSAYTVVANDRGKVIECTGTFTLSITAAATLGSGFFFHVRKRDGSGVVTIDPNGTEQIDGLTTISVYQEAFTVFTDGTAWYTQNRPKGWVSIAEYPVTSAVTTVSFTTAFGDTELRDMEFRWGQIAQSTPTAATVNVSRSGSAISTSTYVGCVITVNGAGSTVAGAAATAPPSLRVGATAGASSGRIVLENFRSTTGANAPISMLTVAGTVYSYVWNGYENTNGAPIDGIQFNWGNTLNTTGTFSQRGFRA